MTRNLALPALALTAFMGVAILIACTPPEAKAWEDIVDDLNEDGTSPSHPGHQVAREHIVYVTLDNGHYHRAGCRVLDNHRYKRTSRQFAITHGHRRCPICNPA